LFEFLGGVGTEQAVGTHFDQAAGQDVLQEAADEILGAESDALDLLGPIVPVTEGHLALIEAFDPAIGDGDPEDVAAQVIEHLLSLAGVLAVEHPVVFPDSG